MDFVYKRCCGIDIHKKVVSACFRSGSKSELRKFDSHLESIRELGNWLLENHCQITAMESKSPHWESIYNILESLNLDVMVVNAHYMKSVPARKTVTEDAEWIAKLLQCGLLEASYIPEKKKQELREIADYRRSLIENRLKVLSYLMETLEGMEINQTSQVMDMLNLIRSRPYKPSSIEKIDEQNTKDLVYFTLQSKKLEFLQSVDGALSPMQKQLVEATLDQIDAISVRIEDLDNMIDTELRGYKSLIKAIK